MPAEALRRQDVAARAVRWQAILVGEAEGPHRPTVAVALDAAGEVAGFASCGEARGPVLRAHGLTGEVSALYLLRRVQRQGLGRELMAWAAGALQELGHPGLGLWVLRDNLPARGFYEALGGRPLAEKDDEIAGVPVVEVAYGWPAPAALISASATTSAACANMGVGSSQ